MSDKGRGGYPSDVTDEEWAFVLPYLLLCREDSPQRKHELRTVFNAVRYVARTGGQWRFPSPALPPPHALYPQMQRRLQPGWLPCVAPAPHFPPLHPAAPPPPPAHP